MSKLDITILGEPVLRQKARRVREFDGKLHQLLDDMRETMLDAPGVGLAAPQVDVSQRIIVVRLPDDEESVKEHGDQAGVLYEVINPEIARVSPEMIDGIEGCLSIPGYIGRVDRHVSVSVRGQDRHGKMMRIQANNWLARVFQHEIDHLDGVLYIDRASEVWKATEPPPDGPLPLEQAEASLDAGPAFAQADDHSSRET
ncbi:MAG: peptide deformylase [Anaerolineae bacterium]|nr:peptide deformylase [Anaerolineae bacterium]